MYILKKIWNYKKKVWKPLSHNVLNMVFENCSHYPLNGKILYNSDSLQIRNGDFYKWNWHNSNISVLLQDTTTSPAHPKSFLLPSLRYLTRSKLLKKNSAWIFSKETIINWLWHRKVKSSIKMPKNFWLMRMLSDLNCTNSVSRLHLSASESRQCLEPFTCRICIFLWRKNSLT